MVKKVEETALSRAEEFTSELTVAQDEAAAVAEIQAAVSVALKYPRDETRAVERILEAAGRAALLDQVIYHYPRGDTLVTGICAPFAREAARLWGNLWMKVEVVLDDDSVRKVRAVCWDVESNTRHSAEDQFRKLIQRLDEKGRPKWIVPDERDLRELTNRRAAMLLRNCILALLPDNVRQQIGDAAMGVLSGDAQERPTQAGAKIAQGFAKLGVDAASLAQYLGCPLDAASPKQIAELRGIYGGIRDGQATWEDVLRVKTAPPGLPGLPTPPAPAAPSGTEPPRTGISRVQAAKLQQTAVRTGWTSKEIAEMLAAEFHCSRLDGLALEHFARCLEILEGSTK